MKTLTLEHLAPYLPYGLKGKDTLTGFDADLDGLVGDYITDNSCGERTQVNIENFKPILRPLSDLTKEIEHNGERFVPIVHLLKPMFTIIEVENVKLMGKMFVYEGMPLFSTDGMVFRYEKFQKLFEWHFDVFGLIEDNLAIDINELNN